MQSFWLLPLLPSPSVLSISNRFNTWAILHSLFLFLSITSKRLQLFIIQFQIPAFLHCHADKILRTGKYLNVIQQCDTAKSDQQRRGKKRRRVIIFTNSCDVIDGNNDDETDDGMEGKTNLDFRHTVQGLFSDPHKVFAIHRAVVAEQSSVSLNG